MATVEHIQIRQVEEQRATTQEIEIGGIRLILRANYSAVADRWYLTIADLNDVAILAGIVCVPGVNLLLPYKHLTGIPQGELFCDGGSDREPPTFATMDATARVLYR